ncbi:MAG: hypothetical protein RDV48_28835 [Candidatus Eremiobacteraeota bacterium]|nr:hypothetical protein [Candidatus Eremiobacteraeota bacterium]
MPSWICFELRSRPGPQFTEDVHEHIVLKDIPGVDRVYALLQGTFALKR